LGSQITSISPYRRAFQKMLKMVDDLRNSGTTITHVDLGGGFGIPYKKGEKRVQPEKLAKMIETPLRSRSLDLILEPGRSIIGNAGILITEILYVKKGIRRNFIVVDAAMNDLIRPALYQAYHEILPVRNSNSSTLLADIVGPVCETGDFLAQGRRIPRSESGDLLAILNAGAYGFSMSSNYNGRRRPAEILVEGNRSKVIRRRETYQDLSRTEM
jgi:diaminopimelate decarboxylase